MLPDRCSFKRSNRCPQVSYIQTMPLIAKTFACNVFPLFQENPRFVVQGKREEGKGVVSYHTVHTVCVDPRMGENSRVTKLFFFP